MRGCCEGDRVVACDRARAGCGFCWVCEIGAEVGAGRQAGEGGVGGGRWDRQRLLQLPRALLLRGAQRHRQ
jgi:hypothetical protein